MKYPPEGLLYDTAENQDAIAGRRGLELACMEGRTLEARAVRCDGNCNLYVELNGRLAVIPRGEAILDPARQKDVAVLSRVGRPVCFKVLCAPGGSEEEPRLLLSRRAAQEEAMEYFMTKLTPGEVIWCTVTRLESFGAFVDIGRGIPSFIGMENISVSRIRHPADRFRPGQLIPAVVTAIDRTVRRVFLSHKELLGTWEENAAFFTAGDTVEGIVRGIEPYGIFVELAPNLSGLAELREDLHEGQRVCVYIKSILPDKAKIKLSIIDVLPDCPIKRPIRYFFPGKRVTDWTYTGEISSCTDKSPT